MLRCCWLVLLLPTLGFAQSEPAAPTAAELEALVKQLGDRAFRVREKAARQLVGYGLTAVPALTAGLKSDDPCIVLRCRQLLPEARAFERNEALAVFLKPGETTIPKTLPGAAEFLKLTGDSKEHRELYAALCSAYSEILDEHFAKKESAKQKFRGFCLEAYERWRSSLGQSGRTMSFSKSELVLFFWLSPEMKLQQSPRVGGFGGAATIYEMGYMFLNDQELPGLLSGSSNHALLIKKLFLNWLEHETNITLHSRGMNVATQSGMKDMSPLYLKTALDKGKSSLGRAQAMIGLLKMGDPKIVKDLAPLLEEKTVITTVNFGGGMKNTTVQVRDVALGVSVLLSKQKLADYGYDGSRNEAIMQQTYIYYGFAENEVREAALRKWQEWRMSQERKD